MTEDSCLSVAEAFPNLQFTTSVVTPSLMAAKHLVRFLDLRYALLLLAFISITCFAVALGIYDHSGAKYQDYVTDWGDGLAVASVSLQFDLDKLK